MLATELLPVFGVGLSFKAAMRSAADFETSIINLAKAADRPLDEKRARIMGLTSLLGSYTGLAPGDIASSSGGGQASSAFGRYTQSVNGQIEGMLSNMNHLSPDRNYLWQE